MVIPKKRLDVLVVEKGLAPTRQRAQALIMAGKVLVDRQRIEKPGTPVRPSAVIDVKGDGPPYVSRGGVKLAAALDRFDIDVAGRACMDVGASTGGFTDCLLQRGATQVFAVDVGYGQLDWSLRQDPRVVVIERTNIRHISFDMIGALVDLITVDVSFISLKLVLPAVMPFLKPKASIVALIKPQFEVGKGQVGKGGVVRDPALREAVVLQLTEHFLSQGLDCRGVIPSPLEGPKGNQEYLMRLDRLAQNANSH